MKAVTQKGLVSVALLSALYTMPVLSSESQYKILILKALKPMQKR